ncbi:lysophospholipase L1-like esterase [Acidovorax soli]|uniref:Lysophospholipase L1-like esterase n=1 Tax=Acidovorax soli TaxID=592050 RepID=A0A7X0U9S4_9BURK|nr:SGNH/GDSL hydrolase family protein [Acidovorax soli]MBB6559845.1 lysophospholipase L1-like esterase [Acidovorax soli]
MPTLRHSTFHALRPRWWTLAAVAAGALLLTGCAPWRLMTASDLAKASRPYAAQPAQPERRILVVGDSTAVGTGAARPEDSLAGRIGAAHPRWQIDNLARNGAKFEDVQAQLEQARPGYDLVLVLAGGNDVIRLTSEQQLHGHMEQAIRTAKARGKQVVLMPCGNVGHAPLFMPPVSWFLEGRSKRLHATAQAVALESGVRYIRLLKPRAQDPFVQRADALHAADGLHPSSAGYQQWYEELLRQEGLASLTGG